MNLNKWHIMLFALLFYNISWAQSRKLTLDQAIDQAIKNNRDVQSAILEIDKANAAVHEAFGYALPSLDVSANFSHFLQKPKIPILEPC